MIVGGNQQNLRRWVNSKVEIRGTSMPEGASSRGTGTSGTATSAGTATGSGTGTGTGTGTATGSGASRTGQTGATAHSGEHDGQKLRVTSVKQIASSCSADNR